MSTQSVQHQPPRGAPHRLIQAALDSIRAPGLCGGFRYEEADVVDGSTISV
eukprot:CAMPEP_0204081758 /NCGR_PEP_ID=MMETSP0360-20130528/176014_1 /ASSEMBLY_ACC=CAM_ASM_000342 /TAXON_ID=268821 /ORGANISM="Scrippsiella Hangoei, Strain SHTV-5" /LENGTH=50 /DNA_ID=CAMNT_0051030605 /DNA_START=513 /DNA_END=662 /DNA_ORIENTATION=-